MYEGAPNHPEPDRFWDIIDRHGVTIFYTAPTAIRAFMRWGDDYVKKHSLASLRLLGSVGEPINPEAWMWYHTLIGKKRCPIVDTWWQTETGAIMVSPLPGVTGAKPGSCTRPFFGVVPKILDDNGKEVPKGSGGRLFLTQPWPSMLRTLWNDDERYKKQYWSEIPGIYFAGDGARFDKDGYLWVVGRIDDVLNVSLVGYTNAGKSTLFNALTHAGVYAANKLFATLDTTSRKLWVEGGGRVVISDTVGFIRDLPHGLVAAFHATLEATAEADLLLHVVDSASPVREQQMREVDKVLNEIGAGLVPQIVVWNKIDLTGVAAEVEQDDYGRIARVRVSARTGEGLALLRAALAESARVREQNRAAGVRPDIAAGFELQEDPCR
ncbi:MAG: Acetyl-coenzyme A synthetase [Betaproteobacteria bacterium ADurb.Bin341]|nr:MAG: Acetyl-coenzyme A synthetase [Betaproteobacteria bacterium ADurb.Bin341]